MAASKSKKSAAPAKSAAAAKASAAAPAAKPAKPLNPRAAIIAALNAAYWMEIETTLNYIANSINLDGVRAEEIKKSLLMDIPVEIGHAQTLGKRIKELGGKVQGSAAFTPGQARLQPPRSSTDVTAVIRGVIEAEDAAIAQYNLTIRLCEGIDYVTQDTCIRLLAEEETHCQEFHSFLKEYQKKG